MLFQGLNGSPLYEELDLDSDGAGGGAAGAGEGAGAGTPPPEPPAFSLEIDDRTRYADPNEARRGFLSLKADRDTHKGRADTLEAEVRRLKQAIVGEGPESAKKTALSNLSQEDREKTLRWFQAVNPELKFVTMDSLNSPEMQALLGQMVEQRVAAADLDRNIARGKVHIGSVLKRHEIELTAVQRAALHDHVAAVLEHEDSTALLDRFLSGDMSVLDEIVEDRFGAEIKSKADVKAAAEAQKGYQRDQRGQFARTAEANDKMRKLPSPPPKGGAAATGAPPPPVLKTPEERKARALEILSRGDAA